MADLAVKTVHKTRAPGVGSYLMANGVTLYEGMLAQNQSGYLNHWDGTGQFLGIVLGGDDRAKDGVLTGNTSDTPVPEARVDESGVILMHKAVAGSPTQASVGLFVYCADSDVANFTIADTGTPAVGVLDRYRSSSDCDVELFSAKSWAALNGVAPATGNIYSIQIPIVLATVTAGDVATSVIIPHAFKITRVDALVTTAATTAAKAATLNLEIGTTNLTGGAVALTSANCTPLGAVVAGSAVTAANIGAAGDALSVEGASVTAFVEGAVLLNVWIQNLDSN